MYIPKNRILTNQYTSDNKLMVKETQEFYRGYYYKTFEGKYFTGKTPNELPNVELVEVEDVGVTYKPEQIQNEIAFGDFPTIFDEIDTPGYDEGMVVDYARLQGINLLQSTRTIIPTQAYPTPSIDDYELGQFTRYFAIKINQDTYLELNNEVYGKLKKQDAGYLWQPYQCFKIQWTITGIEEEVRNTNNNIVLIQERKMKRQGFGRFLKFNFTKFYLPTE
jgi:hypothetical protein|tara:strand:+ start:1924 stop:2586 length:663 start_codon:yes stop_codon:yes gene_type:complete